MPRTAATRERMIIAAERLFAQRGIEAVSLREIATASGQRNHSATQYQFGSREELVLAIFRHRMGPINERRMAMLAEMDASGRGSDLRSIVEAFVYPLAESMGHTESPSYYVRFTVRAASDPGFVLLEAPIGPELDSLLDIYERVGKCLSGLPPEIRAERIRLLAILGGHALALREQADEAGHTEPGGSLSLLAADLVDTMIGMLMAPVSDDARREVAAGRRRGA